MTAAIHVQPSPEAGLQQLPRKPVSDVKREGWRGVMRSVDSTGRLLMTNHDQPEAVIRGSNEGIGRTSPPLLDQLQPHRR